MPAPCIYIYLECDCCFRSNSIKYLTQEFETFLIHLSGALNIEIMQPLDVHQTMRTLTNHIQTEIQETSQDKNDLVSLLNLCCTEFENLHSHTAADKTNAVANVYLLVSYLKTFLNINVPFIDPMVKITLLRKYCVEDIEDSTILKHNYELQNRVYSDSQKSLHVYADLLGNKIERLNAEKEEYQKYVSVRPKDASYDVLVQVIIICSTT